MLGTASGRVKEEGNAAPTVEGSPIRPMSMLFMVFMVFMPCVLALPYIPLPSYEKEGREASVFIAIDMPLATPEGRENCMFSLPPIAPCAGRGRAEGDDPASRLRGAAAMLLVFMPRPCWCPPRRMLCVRLVSVSLKMDETFLRKWSKRPLCVCVV